MTNLALVTNSPTAACSMFYDHVLKSMSKEYDCFQYHFITIDQLYKSNIVFDIICIMIYDIKHVPDIKKMKSSSKIGIVDPRNSHVFVSQCDFIIVDSQEMMMFWQGRGFAGKILMLSEYPDVSHLRASNAKDKKEKNDIIIAYHGNFIHLASSLEMISGIDRFQKSDWALKNKKKIKFIVMMAHQFSQDLESLMKRYPDILYEFVPWSLENYSQLECSTIGLVPNNMPSAPDASYTRLYEEIAGTKFNMSDDDQFGRWKMPSNGGRIITFSQIPGERTIIADCYPSACSLLGKNEWGYIAGKSDISWEKMIHLAVIKPKDVSKRIDLLLKREKEDFIRDLSELLS